MRVMEALFAPTIAATESELRTPAPDSPDARARRRESFRSQTPLALLALGAVAAIVAVNQPARVPPPVVSPNVVVAPSTAADPAAGCFNCGEIVSVELVSLHPDDAPTIKTFELGVRMNDGTLRTVRQYAPVFELGDRVRLDNRALGARG